LTIPVRANLIETKPATIRFGIWKRYIEERGGLKMDDNKLYEIKGTVEGVYDFEIVRTARDYVRLYVPIEYHDRIQLGKVYNIGITSMKEVPITEAQRRILDWAKRGVPWQRIITELTT